MERQIEPENVRDFLALAKRVTPYLTKTEFERILMLYDAALERLESEGK